jgi:hypothetical protein
MAKQGKVLPARRPRGKESLLIRSAESIGRVIGTLQRQLDGPPPRHTAGNGSTKTPPTNGRARSTTSAARKAAGGARVTTRAAKSATKKR